MKKRYSVAFSLIISSLILTSCSEISFLPYENYIDPIETKHNIDNEIYYSQDHYNSLAYEKYDGTADSIDT